MSRCKKSKESGSLNNPIAHALEEGNIFPIASLIVFLNFAMIVTTIAEAPQIDFSLVGQRIGVLMTPLPVSENPEANFTVCSIEPEGPDALLVLSDNNNIVRLPGLLSALNSAQQEIGFSDGSSTASNPENPKITNGSDSSPQTKERSLLQQAAECEECELQIAATINELADDVSASGAGSYVVYESLHTVWSDDVISNLFSNIGQLLGKWITEFITGYLSDAALFFTGALRRLILAPGFSFDGNSSDPLERALNSAGRGIYNGVQTVVWLTFSIIAMKKLIAGGRAAQDSSPKRSTSSEEKEHLN